MNDVADPFAPDAIAAIAPKPAGPFDRANFRARSNPDGLPVLALDLGTVCGFALRTAAGVTSGVLDLQPRAKGTRGQRLMRLWRFLFDVQQATPLAWVAHELVQGHGPGGFETARAYAQYEGVVILFAERAGIEVRSVHTGTLKKAITGKGAWPKGQGKAKLLEAVQARGYAPDAQDEADAIAVLEYFTGTHV